MHTITKYAKMDVSVSEILNLGRASFFVSPARHGEAQDMSGT